MATFSIRFLGCKVSFTDAQTVRERLLADGPAGAGKGAPRLEGARAFVKIQDGCSFSCAFCVTPLVRGGTRSRRADAVLREIERRVEQGHREIVLTGGKLGCFR